MRPTWWMSLGALGILALAGCGPTPPRIHRGFEGNTYFLCCTLRFNKDHEASDAGYFYNPGTTLPAGTPVQVIHEEDRLVTIRPAGANDRYNLIFRFGRNAMSPGEFFQEVLLRDDPRGE